MTPPTDAEPRHTNRLARETSPYLLQHQHNPVDWYPWGEDAIDAARALDRPIFLSIGYSTCYWCHVMERESFESEATAEVMNEHYVCIKVDREERPDIDAIYMTACQVFTELTEGRASGGWPLSVFLDPQTLEPFFVGTYFPPEPRYGRPSFTQVLEGLSDAWRTRRDEVTDQAQRIATIVARQLSAVPAARTVGPATVETAVNTLMSIHDRTDGGFGGAPKFPQPTYLALLMEAAWDRPAIREALIRTADRMALGGIHDQIGGGFHRYSVDGQWVVPHFEKMLYDNGQLATFYATLVERTGDTYYARVLRDLLTYVRREMTAPDGAFFSAQDAEVNAREGGNYVWTADEVRAALGDAGRADLVEPVLTAFGLDGGPNFQDPHHPEAAPVNVLVLADRPEALADRLQVEPAALLEQLDAARAILLPVRDARPQPGTDDKILAGWNGLMIAGMADGGRVLEEPVFVQAAATAARAVLGSMTDEDGGLRRVSRGGVARIPAFLEDYAFMIHGLLALHAATGEDAWLNEAQTLLELAEARFHDLDSGGGYFDTLAGQSDLFVRARQVADGAVPSGNSVMLMNLVRLGEMTGEERYLDLAERHLSALSGTIAASPVMASGAVAAAHRLGSAHPDRLPRGDATRDDPVAVRVDPPRPSIAAAPTTIVVTLEVPGGLHLNAHEPSEPGLVGVTLELIDGDGLEIDVRYPEGVTHHGQDAVLLGTIEIEATVRRVGSVTGSPSLLLTYQACTERECLAPRRRPIRLVVADDS